MQLLNLNRSSKLIATLFVCASQLWSTGVSSPTDGLEPLSETSDMSFHERLRAVAAIDSFLEADAREDCLRYVRSAKGLNTLTASQNHQLKNDLLRALRKQADEDEKLTLSLLAIYEDGKQDAVMRDYAVQHLSIVYPDSKYQARIDEIFLDALRSRGDTRAAVALLACMRLVQASELNQDLVPVFERTCLSICGDETAQPAARVSAILAAGELRIPGSMDVLTPIINNESTIFSLRLATIGALGKMQTPAAQVLLKNELETSNPTLKRAAIKALESYQS